MTTTGGLSCETTPELQINKRTLPFAYEQQDFPLLQSLFNMKLQLIPIYMTVVVPTASTCLDKTIPRFKSQSRFVWPKTGKSDCWSMNRLKVPKHGNLTQPGSCLLIALIMVSSTSTFFSICRSKSIRNKVSCNTLTLRWLLVIYRCGHFMGLHTRMHKSYQCF